MMGIKECVMCHCTYVPHTELEVSINSKHIISVKVNGAKCSNCGEEYYDLETLKAIEETEGA
jgi:YgiT-type zinc finger domain-containing protein